MMDDGGQMWNNWVTEDGKSKETRGRGLEGFYPNKSGTTSGHFRLQTPRTYGLHT